MGLFLGSEKHSVGIFSIFPVLLESDIFMSYIFRILRSQEKILLVLTRKALFCFYFRGRCLSWMLAGELFCAHVHEISQEFHKCV